MALLNIRIKQSGSIMADWATCQLRFFGVARFRASLILRARESRPRKLILKDIPNSWNGISRARGGGLVIQISLSWKVFFYYYLKPFQRSYSAWCVATLTRTPYVTLAQPLALLPFFAPLALLAPLASSQSSSRWRVEAIPPSSIRSDIQNLAPLTYPVDFGSASVHPPPPPPPPL